MAQDENLAALGKLAEAVSSGNLAALYRVTVTLENVRHWLPSGTIGEGAVDENDSLHGRVRRG